jgi:hypothetical protein
MRTRHDEISDGCDVMLMMGCCYGQLTVCWGIQQRNNKKMHTHECHTRQLRSPNLSVEHDCCTTVLRIKYAIVRTFVRRCWWERAGMVNIWFTSTADCLESFEFRREIILCYQFRSISFGIFDKEGNGCGNYQNSLEHSQK